MAILIIGLIVFLGVHSVKIAFPNWRATVMVRYGEGPYKGVYSLIAALGLVLIVWGFYRAWIDPVFLYFAPIWGRHLALTLMAPALILAFASVFPAGWIRRYINHPLLAATILWSAAHILANGDLAGLVLFAAFLVWAIVDWIAQPEVVAGPTKVGSFGLWDIAAVAAGIGLYVVLIAGLHYLLFGVSPIV